MASFDDSAFTPSAHAMPVFDLAKRRPSLPNINIMRLFHRKPASTTSAPTSARPPLRQRTNSDSPVSPKRTKSSKKRKAPPADDIASTYGFEFARSVRLLQEMDGGSTEYNVQRLLKKRAKAVMRAGGTRTHSTCGGGVDAAPIQGADGRLFASAQEREEHQRLLSDA